MLVSLQSQVIMTSANSPSAVKKAVLMADTDLTPEWEWRRISDIGYYTPGLTGMGSNANLTIKLDAANREASYTAVLTAIWSRRYRIRPSPLILKVTETKSKTVTKQSNVGYVFRSIE